MWLATVVVVLSCGLTLAVTLVFSRALQRVLEAGQRAQDRHAENEAKLQDRLMAMDFATYKAYQRPPDQAEQIMPDEEIPPADPADLELVWDADAGEYMPQ